MLEGVRAICERGGIPAQLALEAGMACGFGACFGCVVPKRGGGYLGVCIDGPGIDAAELERLDAHAGGQIGDPPAGASSSAACSSPIPSSTARAPSTRSPRAGFSA